MQDNQINSKQARETLPNPNSELENLLGSFELNSEEANIFDKLEDGLLPREKGSEPSF